MEKTLKFNSQVATSRVQSERLLACGLKKETADMHLQSTLNDVWSPYIPIVMPWSKIEAFNLSKDVFRTIPAWSLGRLLEILRPMMENQNEITIPFDTTFDQIIDCIEWLIKEGYFNKEYLE